MKAVLEWMRKNKRYFGASLLIGLPLFAVLTFFGLAVFDKDKLPPIQLQLQLPEIQLPKIQPQLVLASGTDEPTFETLSAATSLDAAEAETVPPTANTLFSLTSGEPSTSPGDFLLFFNPLLDYLKKQGNVPYELYIVQPGDTLYSIASLYGLDVNTLYWNNPGVNAKPEVNTAILIPPADGFYYVVSPGEKLDALAKKYAVNSGTLFNWNGFLTSNTVATETIVFLPGAKRVATEMASEQPEGFQSFKNAYTCPIGLTNVGTGTFMWPLENVFESGYPYDEQHKGLDLGLYTGQPVYASDGGVVVFAGESNVGYGNLVIIDHYNGYLTYYAHLSEFKVTCGQPVAQGDIIGLGGSTGNSSGPHLHFEIRKGLYSSINPYTLVKFGPEEFFLLPRE